MTADELRQVGWTALAEQCALETEERRRRGFPEALLSKMLSEVLYAGERDLEILAEGLAE